MCSDKRFPHVLVFLAFLQLIITCPGCSVKENRDLCPCVLELDASGDRHAGDSISLSLAGASAAAVGFLLEDKMGERWVSMVPRGKMYLGAVWPADVSTVLRLPPDKWLEIEPGRECPRVWMDCRALSTKAEHVTVPLLLHKAYCELTIFIRDVSGGDFPYRLEVRGNVDGYLMDGTPSEGEFMAPADYTDDSGDSGAMEAHVVLPRQIDNSLLLDIISDDDRRRTFAIGNYIEASGYDWESMDLKDITLDIDYARTDITFRIDAWERTVQFEVVI